MFTVVSDVGGLLGLFLGCSILSIVEIFYFLLAALFRYVLRNRANSKISTVEKKPNCQDPEIRQIFDLLLELRKDVNRLDQRVSECAKKIAKLESNFLEVEDI